MLFDLQNTTNLGVDFAHSACCGDHLDPFRTARRQFEVSLADSLIKLETFGLETSFVLYLVAVPPASPPQANDRIDVEEYGSRRDDTRRRPGP